MTGYVSTSLGQMYKVNKRRLNVFLLKANYAPNYLLKMLALRVIQGIVDTKIP